MTVSYSAEVSTTSLTTFARLLFRWKGSVYKLLWKELFIFIFLFAFFKTVCELVFTCTQQRFFGQWANQCRQRMSGFPLTFIMGFYVNMIIKRWWSIFQCIGCPDRVCMYVAMCVTSNEKAAELSKQYRRAIARYLNLAQLLVLRNVSASVKTRYPTLDHVVKDGFMTPEEKEVYDAAGRRSRMRLHHRYWLVIQWACDVLHRAAANGLVRDALALSSTQEQIVAFRDQLGSMLGYFWVTIPLSHTQVVTMIVYVYFLAGIFGQQYLNDSKCVDAQYNGTWTSSTVATAVTLPQLGTAVERHQTEMYIPVFLLLEFIFIVGLLKVAQSIMNPLGEDDDDFEINYIITRNMDICYAIVDTFRDSCPPVHGETQPTPAETDVKAHPHIGSTDYQPRDFKQYRWPWSKPAPTAEGTKLTLASHECGQDTKAAIQKDDL